MEHEPEQDALFELQGPDEDGCVWACPPRRLCDITQVRPRGTHMRVRGIASSGNRYYRHHVGFTCNVDRRGRVGIISFSRW